MLLGFKFSIVCIIQKLAEKIFSSTAFKWLIRSDEKGLKCSAVWRKRWSVWNIMKLVIILSIQCLWLILMPMTEEEEVQVCYNIDDRVLPINTVPIDRFAVFITTLKFYRRNFKMTSIYVRTFKLRPWTIIICGNWRLLHVYTGRRTMNGCYASRDDYQSALRVNGFIE